MTDEELVAKITQSNNTVLFEILYDRYADLVYNKCYGFAKSADEAKDLTQDVFLKLFVKLSSFKGKSKFSTWLYAFTYNHCVNYVTRNTAKKIEKNAVEAKEIKEESYEEEDYSLYQMKVDKLKIALEEIPPNDKMIILLKYQDYLTINELEGILGIGESAVKMRLKRAKDKLINAYNTL
ncbi:RNA polymerase sigma factor [Mangrovimonas spongiae]|uniref:Sigma-70 family RNA polymerase sigma factor n=1 Tax=Mangrovimonas spongiae TaxID=2494697 RepID=A0A3R9N6N8_9FLAO|nr:sigma-70 family RNA polymerase sigma factor [Mangrovimonas spongiae]RSK40239.1 sigma-70 family RNA polymerase sigma factor [Mangrovimonas spongiae]